MTLGLVVWELRSSLRQVIRSHAARLVLSTALLAVAFGPFVYYLLRPPTEYALTTDVVVGFVGLNLLFSTAAAAFGLSYLLDTPERLEALSLAPLEPGEALVVALSPAVILGLVPVTALLLPYVLLTVRLSPLLALAAVVTGLCVLCWALVLAVSLGALLVRRMGVLRAGQGLRALAGLLGLLSAQLFGRLVRVELGAAMLVGFLVVSPVALGPLGRWAAQSLGAALGRGEGAHVAKEPNWGQFSLGRQLWSSSEPLALLGLLPAALVVWLMPSARLAILSVLTMVASNGPLERLLETERAMPDRLALAPRGAAFQVQAFLLGGVVWLVSVGGLLLGLWNLRAWVGVHAVFMLAMLASNAMPLRALRIGLQGVLLLGSLVVATTWAP